VQNEE